MGPLHFSRVTLTNFKGHRHTEVPLSRFTLLVGANGSGKTSVLEGIRFAADAVGSSGARSGSRSSDLFREGLEPEVVRFSFPEESLATEGAHDLRLRLELSGSPETVDVTLPAGSLEPRVLIAGHEPTSGKISFAPPFVALGGVGLLRLDAKAIAAPSVSDSEIPVVGLDGSGLATALKELKANDEARFDAFRTAVRQVIPLVEDFRFARRKRIETRARHIRVEDQMVEVPQPHTVILDELLIRFAGTGFVPARAASEGTLITLALLAALFTTQLVSRLLLIDDLDRGLHIEAQGQLVQALRRILEQQPEVQIIATAHSPYLVDHFSPDEVVVLRRTDVGQPIQASRLSEHPDTVLREFKTGEALVATGKDWFG